MRLCWHDVYLILLFYNIVLLFFFLIFVGCGAFTAVTAADDANPDSLGRLVRLRLPALSLTANDGNIDKASTTATTTATIGEEPAPTTTTTAAAEAVSFPQTAVTISALKQQESKQSSRIMAPVERPVVLVGKGVCYDTGGVNVKSANSMKTMKIDMAGSSTALGTFLALSQLRTLATNKNITENQSNEFLNINRYPVECWLALAENNINDRSYRPDDVVYSVTGESIEVVHTDAEGRMLLADVLALASRKVNVDTISVAGGGVSVGGLGSSNILPSCLLDFATLTGTCIASLSNRYIGAFSNRIDLATATVEAGVTSGERAWSFPVDEDFDDDLKSDVADMLQCRQATEADHIYAALFLKRFVHQSVPWVHLDLASAYRPGGLGHVTTDITGCGVRLAVQLLHTRLS